MCPPLFVRFIGGIHLSIVYFEVIYNIKIFIIKVRVRY